MTTSSKARCSECAKKSEELFCDSKNEWKCAHCISPAEKARIEAQYEGFKFPKEK